MRRKNKSTLKRKHQTSDSLFVGGVFFIVGMAIADYLHTKIMSDKQAVNSSTEQPVIELTEVSENCFCELAGSADGN